MTENETDLRVELRLRETNMQGTGPSPVRRGLLRLTTPGCSIQFGKASHSVGMVGSEAATVVTQT